MRKGSRNAEGRRRFVEDILLHEMIHQWTQEVTRQGDEHYSGHGPAFSAKANEIGVKLGLPDVGKTCKARDRKNEEPSPSYWPSNVRPDGYYQGAVQEKTSCVSTSKDTAGVDVRRHVLVHTGDMDLTVEILRKNFDVDELRRRLSIPPEPPDEG